MQLYYQQRLARLRSKVSRLRYRHRAFVLYPARWFSFRSEQTDSAYLVGQQRGEFRSDQLEPHGLTSTMVLRPCLRSLASS